jgi:nucleoside 2-deoxyribosyltransferase
LATCFVIQPFDTGGKFDKRYVDIFAPAIRDADLEPYRVDNNPAANVSIDEIENGIRRAAVCLADVTDNSSSVWFELGYALASKKEVCLVCSEERFWKYPLNVKHRSIMKYRLETADDFASFQDQITIRLKAIIAKLQQLAIVAAQCPIKETEDLLRHEMIVLVSITANLEGSGRSVRHGLIKEDLERLGYNNLALNIGLEGLLARGMISGSDEWSSNDPCLTYSLKSSGIDWIRRNHNRLILLSVPADLMGRRVGHPDEDSSF